MTTWEDYKNEVRARSEDDAREIAEIEMMADLVATVISARKKRGLSQKDLAAVSLVSENSIANFESGKTEPRITTLLKIMQPLGVKLQVGQGWNTATNSILAT